MSDLLPNPTSGPFSALFREVGWGHFFACHWAKRPLQFAGGGDVLKELPRLAEFPQLIAGRLNGDKWEQGTFSVQGTFESGGRKKTLVLPPEMWAQAFNVGISLCFNAVDRWNQKLRALVDDCTEASRFRGFVDATAFLAPKRASSREHYECQHVFFLQVSGESQWRLSKLPAAHCPPKNMTKDLLQIDGVRSGLDALGLKVRSPGECEVEERVLREGEILYLPPGTWRETCTKDSVSLHYALNLHSVSFSTLLNAKVRMLMLASGAWREELRFVVSEDELAHALALRVQEFKAAASRLTKEDLLDVQANISQLPPMLRDYLMLSGR
jgi:hypothetical protein